MRLIELKYGGQCAKCGADLETGKQAMYEKSMGIFCLGCEPKDAEEIRHFRTLRAERKAERLDGWAEKREKKAEADLNSYPSIRHDWAFITQPGRSPFRERMNRADDRALESLDVAKGMRERAANIRKVRVAGDAERRRQEEREAADKLIKKGDRVYEVMGGEGTVIGVYAKSFRIKFDRGFTWSRDKSYVRPL
jgi:hypothetical protein